MSDSLACFSYDYEIDPDSDTSHARVLRLVGEGKRVLELGCATGYMSKILQSQGCEVVGVEIDPEAATRAASFCEQIVVGDIEEIDFEQELGNRKFDVITAADVLEHLKDPAAVLRTLKSFLESDGYLVFSIPNTAHGSLRLALLSGKFDYSDVGLLDRSHLRFYTKETLPDLFDQGGFVMVYLERTFCGLEDPPAVPFDRNALPPGVAEYIADSPEALTFQFVGLAYPVSEAQLGSIPALIRRIHQEGQDAEFLRTCLGAKRAEVAALRSQLSSTRQLQTELLGAQDTAVRRQVEIHRLGQRLADLSQHADGLTHEIHAIHSSRLWRWGGRLARVKAIVARP